MTISEVKMDIMQAPQGYALVNCISNDLNFEYGLPKLFDSVFGIKEKLDDNQFFIDSSDDPIGYTFMIENVLNVIIKENCRDRFDSKNMIPIFEAIKNSLNALLIKKVAIPKLFTGKNGMDWVDVKATIEYVFRNTDIDFIVCTR